MAILTRTLRGWVIIVCLSVFFSSAPLADVTIEGKPESYATVQDAVDAAVSGDILVLSADTFASFVITKALTIKGAGAGLSIIDSTVTGEPCVKAEADFELEDLTCTGLGKGVIWATSPVISGVIKSCEFTGLTDLSLFVPAGASAVITDSEFHGNFTGPITTVLVADMGSKITFHRNIVKGNSTDISMITYFGNPAALVPSFDPDLLTELSIRNSQFTGNLGDIVLSEFNGQKVEIVNNTIVGNTTSIGFSAPLVIKVDDTGTESLTTDSFSYIVKNNIIAGNFTVTGATVLTLFTNTEALAVIEHNILSGSSMLAPPVGVTYGTFDFSNFTDMMPPPSPSPFPLDPGELFVAPVPAFPGFTSEFGDIHLKTGSVAIDAGTSSAPGATTSDIDLDGLTRIVDGDGDSIEDIDMGCHEFGATTPDDPTVSAFVDVLLIGSLDVSVLAFSISTLPIIKAKDVLFADTAATAISTIVPSAPVSKVLPALTEALIALKPLEKTIPEVLLIEEEVVDLSALIADASVSLVDSLLATPRSSEAMLAQAYRKLEQGDAANAGNKYHVASEHYRAAAELAQRALQHDQ